jgi:hypothetical protein
VHLQADVLAGTECATDTAQHQADGLVGQAEAGGDLVPVFVQPLCGHEQLDTLATGVGYGECRFEAEERLILHADLVGALDHDVADDR